MVRNPWGTSTYSGTWKHDDANWATWKSKVTNGVDPTTANTDGIFFVSSDDFIKVFEKFQIGYFRAAEGYKSSWIDRRDDLGTVQKF